MIICSENMASSEHLPQSSSTTFPDGTQDRRPGSHQQQHVQHRLSSEELQVLKQCNHDSFWYRCVPLQIALIAGSHYAVLQGYIKAGGPFGYLPRIFGCLLVGYMGGKISYIPACKEKLLALPNSRMAESLRKRQAGLELFQETVAFPELSSSPEPPSSANVGDDYHGSLNFDTDRPKSDELDDSQRPSLDRTVQQQSEKQQSEKQDTPQTFLSHDELRRKNREEYQRKQFSQVESFIPPPTPVPESNVPAVRPPPPRRPNFFSDNKDSKNKYGDEWDKD